MHQPVRLAPQPDLGKITEVPAVADDAVLTRQGARHERRLDRGRHGGHHRFQRPHRPLPRQRAQVRRVREQCGGHPDDIEYQSAAHAFDCFDILGDILGGIRGPSMKPGFGYADELHRPGITRGGITYANSSYELRPRRFGSVLVVPEPCALFSPCRRRPQGWAEYNVQGASLELRGDMRRAQSGVEVFLHCSEAARHRSGGTDSRSAALQPACGFSSGSKPLAINPWASAMRTTCALLLTSSLCLMLDW